MPAKNLGELDLFVELVEAVVEATEAIDVLLVLPRHLGLRAVSLWYQSPRIRRREQEQIEPHAGLDQGSGIESGARACPFTLPSASPVPSGLRRPELTGAGVVSG
jgi:hypothetical protein